MGDPPHPVFEAFSRSLASDLSLFQEDIVGSIAHVRALTRAGVVTPEEALRLDGALQALLSEGPASLPWEAGDEDIHTGVERILTERLGELGMRLHTGRSRNDQVAVDFHLYVRQEGLRLATLSGDLAAVLSQKADQAGDRVVAGMTHLQRAQPVLLAHHLLAYAWMFLRDGERFAGASRAAARRCPLGAGALAGTSFELDLEKTARELGFEAPYPNSVDAVSDRDFALEILFAASVSMVHLSRLCEEMVLWSTREFSWMRLSDGFSTGSSMMPQKRNPDVAELVRGRTGSVFGNLAALLATLKGLPLAYMRDMQEDKPPVFQGVQTAAGALEVMALAVGEAEFAPPAVPFGDFSVATDLADVLVERGMPFRTAHRVVAALARRAEERGGQFEQLTLQDFHEASPLFPKDVLSYLDPEKSVQRRRAVGGTSPSAVVVQKATLAKELNRLREAVKAEANQKSDRR